MGNKSKLNKKKSEGKLINEIMISSIILEVIFLILLVVAKQ